MNSKVTLADSNDMQQNEWTSWLSAQSFVRFKWSLCGVHILSGNLRKKKKVFYRIYLFQKHWSAPKTLAEIRTQFYNFGQSHLGQQIRHSGKLHTSWSRGHGFLSHAALVFFLSNFFLLVSQPNHWNCVLKQHSCILKKTIFSCNSGEPILMHKLLDNNTLFNAIIAILLVMVIRSMSWKYLT